MEAELDHGERAPSSAVGLIVASLASLQDRLADQPEQRQGEGGEQQQVTDALPLPALGLAKAEPVLVALDVTEAFLDLHPPAVEADDLLGRPRGPGLVRPPAAPATAGRASADSPPAAAAPTCARPAGCHPLPLALQRDNKGPCGPLSTPKLFKDLLTSWGDLRDRFIYP